VPEFINLIIFTRNCY